MDLKILLDYSESSSPGVVGLQKEEEHHSTVLVIVTGAKVKEVKWTMATFEQSHIHVNSIIRKCRLGFTVWHSLYSLLDCCSFYSVLVGLFHCPNVVSSVCFHSSCVDEEMDIPIDR